LSRSTIHVLTKIKKLSCRLWPLASCKTYVGEDLETRRRSVATRFASLILFPHLLTAPNDRTERRSTRHHPLLCRQCCTEQIRRSRQLIHLASRSTPKEERTTTVERQIPRDTVMAHSKPLRGIHFTSVMSEAQVYRDLVFRSYVVTPCLDSRISIPAAANAFLAGL
jgi:hypothetical protein